MAGLAGLLDDMFEIGSVRWRIDINGMEGVNQGCVPVEVVARSQVKISEILGDVANMDQAVLFCRPDTVAILSKPRRALSSSRVTDE